MAKLEWGYQGRGNWCSYKRTTIIICSINIVAALYVLHSLYISIYIYSNNASENNVKYTQDQIGRMEESIRVRRASEPIELVRLVKEIKEGFSREEAEDLPRPVKQKVTDEILQRLKGLNANANVSEQQVTKAKQKREAMRKQEAGNEAKKILRELGSEK